MQASEDTSQPIHRPSTQPEEDDEHAINSASQDSEDSAAEIQPDDHSDQPTDLTSAQASASQEPVETTEKIETPLPDAPPDDEDTAHCA
jgi:hypothetical protein